MGGLGGLLVRLPSWTVYNCEEINAEKNAFAQGFGKREFSLCRGVAF